MYASVPCQRSVWMAETPSYVPPEKIQVTFPTHAIIWNESGTVEYSGDLQSAEDVVGWYKAECSMFVFHEGRYYNVSATIGDDGIVYADCLPVESYN